MRLLANVPIVYKLPASVIALLLASIAVVLSLSVIGARQIAHDTGGRLLVELAHENADRVETFVANSAEAIELISKAGSLSIALREGRPLNQDAPAAKDLKNFAVEHDFSEVVLAAKDGTVLASLTNTIATGSNLSSRADGLGTAFKSALSTKGLVTTAMSAQAGEERGFLSHSIASISGGTAGVIIAKVDLTSLVNVLELHVDAPSLALHLFRVGAVAEGQRIESVYGTGVITPDSGTEMTAQDYIAASGEKRMVAAKAFNAMGGAWMLTADRAISEVYAGVRGMLQSLLMPLSFVILAAIAVCILMARSVSRPLLAAASDIETVAGGNLTETGNSETRGDEFGAIGAAMSALRTQLGLAKEIEVDASINAAAFKCSAAPMLLASVDGKVRARNDAMERFCEMHGAFFGDACEHELLGKPLEDVHPDLMDLGARLNASPDGRSVFDIREDGEVLSLTCTQIMGPDGTPSGQVIEWENATENRSNDAKMASLETTMITARCSPQGRVLACNREFARALGIDQSEAIGRDLFGIVHQETPDGGPTRINSQLGQGTPVTGAFKLTIESSNDAWLVGGFTPVKGASGDVESHVFVGLDISDSRQAAAVEAKRRDQMEKAQNRVVEVLRNALRKMAEGDLTSTISEPFSGTQDELREDFNAASKRLRQAIERVIDNSETMQGEVDEITRAADDLSRRTEQQAATLEETAASLDLLTNSVTAAAEGANKAKDVVDDARHSAEESGNIVEQAVDAMGEIAKSSDEISKIIGVIDEIAFQTNLLALNAGVEAARAGEAGRGFAVVASEVRALAQRSSDAAREINELISVSGANVSRGVGLVNNTGVALREIVGSVGSISHLVAEIALSAQDQSSSLAEINVAVNQLDQVTQQNAAMFEETSAASHSLSAGAKALAATTSAFNVGGKPGANAAHPPPQTSGKPKDPSVIRPVVTNEGARKIASRSQDHSATLRDDMVPKRQAAAVAMKMQSSVDAADDEWQEF